MSVYSEFKIKYYNSFLSEIIMKAMEMEDADLGKVFDGIRKLFDDGNCFDDVISEDQVTRILDSSFVRKTLLDRLKSTLHILNVSHGFSDGTNSKVIALRRIVINSKVYKSFLPEASFLHELGHIFHVELTGGLNIDPKGFKELLQTNEIKYDDSLNVYFSRVKSKAGKALYSELFADFYMIAAMMNLGISPKGKDCVINVLDPKVKTRISSYFDKMIMNKSKM
jgi:hypothetical protein